MRWGLFSLFMMSLQGEVILEPNPAQGFNSSANNANRIVYFFINKGEDGSVFLQVEPPPFYPSDAKYIAGGVAYISAAQVLQTYTVEEVANLNEVDITFTVVAHPNPFLIQGYQFFGQVYQWGINLDPQAVSFYKLQSVNTTAQFGIVQNLKSYQYNQENGQLIIFTDLLGYNNWLGAPAGALLSPTLIYPYLIQVTEPNEEEAVELTIRVDFTKIARLAVGTYSVYFQFVMYPLSLTQSFNKTLQEISDAQVIQVGYLYNSILGINAYLDGNNALYDPVVADQVILNANKATLVKIYNDTLDAMTTQWRGFLEMSGLTPASKKLTVNMLQYIATSKVKSINFNV